MNNAAFQQAVVMMTREDVTFDEVAPMIMRQGACVELSRTEEAAAKPSWASYTLKAAAYSPRWDSPAIFNKPTRQRLQNKVLSYPVYLGTY